jgi:uncharacterized protein (DUF2267 family)
MATTGLEVFDRTLHTTNVWLDEITAEIGPDRHLAWHVLGAVLRSIRDEILVEQSAHFAAQLPLLVRGAYFDQYRPAAQPASARSQEEFIARIQHDLDGTRPVNAEAAAAAVMRTLNRHVTEGQIRKVRDALPKGVRALWPEPQHKEPQHKEPDHGRHGSMAKSGESAKGAEPARSTGQPAANQPAQGGQRQPPQQQHSETATAQQHAGPKPSAPQSPSAPPHAEPARPASHHPEPRHAAPQSAASQHRAHGAEQEDEAEDITEEIAGEVDIDDEEATPSISRSSSQSGRSAQSPIGASSRPAAKVHAAPGAGRTASSDRKTKSRTKRQDD